MLPTFQPQNPAKSGCPLGWQSCTCFAGAMVASYDRGVAKAMTGCQVRTRTGDTSGGTNLAQVDAAIQAGWHIDLQVTYRLPWATFAKKVQGGCAAILQGWYAPIADSRFDAGRGFRGNHAVAVFPGWTVMDPLADGRASGVYKYHGESYPPYLLKKFAGQLNLATGGAYRPLGDGYVYAAFSRDNVHSYHMSFTGGAFWVYQLGPDGRITGRTSRSFTGPTGAPCLAPERHGWPGHADRIVCRITAGSLRGQYVGIPQKAAHLEVIP